MGQRYHPQYESQLVYSSDWIDDIDPVDENDLDLFVPSDHEIAPEHLTIDQIHRLFGTGL